jgi:hypothetical protein
MYVYIYIYIYIYIHTHIHVQVLMLILLGGYTLWIRGNVANVSDVHASSTIRVEDFFRDADIAHVQK